MCRSQPLVEDMQVCNKISKAYMCLFVLSFFYFHFSFLSNSLCLFIYFLFIIFLLFIFLAVTRLVDYFVFSCLFIFLSASRPGGLDLN